MFRIATFAAVLAAIVLLPAAAYAQASIAGQVKDGSGAVLPGVSVEASGPALIEKVRTVSTDGQGLYRIIDLRPGTYSVTFTLSGFSTLRREGVELTTGFTATVNGSLAVGNLQETITVTGASPVVDTRIGHHGLCHDASRGEHKRGGYRRRWKQGRILATHLNPWRQPQ